METNNIEVKEIGNPMSIVVASKYIQKLNVTLVARARRKFVTVMVDGYTRRQYMGCSYGGSCILVNSQLKKIPLSGMSQIEKYLGREVFVHNLKITESKTLEPGIQVGFDFQISDYDRAKNLEKWTPIQKIATCLFQNENISLNYVL